MENLHHRPIRKFGLSGKILDDSIILRIKGEYVRLIISEMRFAGYVPRLDMLPDFTLDYNEKKEYFEFEISMYGVYVGKRKSEWILGIDETRVVPILQNKLNEFSQEAV